MAFGAGDLQPDLEGQPAGSGAFSARIATRVLGDVGCEVRIGEGADTPKLGQTGQGVGQSTIAGGEDPADLVIQPEEMRRCSLLPLDDENGDDIVLGPTAASEALREAFEEVAAVDALSKDKPLPQGGQTRFFPHLARMPQVKLVVLRALGQPTMLSEAVEVFPFVVRQQLARADVVELKGLLSERAALIAGRFLEKGL